jgi:hypothetical protein
VKTQIITLRSQITRWWDQSKLVDQQVKIASQTPSPGSSVYWCNLNWMSDTEVLTLSLLAVIGNELMRNDILRCELILSLPEKVKQCESLSTMQKAVILRLLEDRLKRKLPFYKNRQEVLLRYFSYRRIKGLISDSVVLRSLARRLRPRIPKSSTKRTLPAGTPLQTSRHRGYRDHGAARPTHKWLPTNDWTLTRQQWTKEQLEELDLEFYSVFLLNPFSICFASAPGKK